MPPPPYTWLRTTVGPCGGVGVTTGEPVGVAVGVFVGVSVGVVDPVGVAVGLGVPPEPVKIFMSSMPMNSSLPTAFAVIMRISTNDWFSADTGKVTSTGVTSVAPASLASAM